MSAIQFFRQRQVFAGFEVAQPLLGSTRTPMKIDI